MKDVFRFVFTRASQKLCDKEIKTVGIPAYSDEDASKLVKKLNQLCILGRKEEYIELLTAYIQSGAFIANLNNLDPLIIQAYNIINCKPSSVSVQAIQSLYKSKAKPANLKKVLKSQKIQVADSLVALSALGIAGLNGNLNYQKILSGINLLEYILFPKPKKITDYQLKKILSYPILLPEGILGIRCCKDERKPGEPKELLAKSSILKKFNQKNVNNPDEKCSGCDCDDNCHDLDEDCICIKPYVSDLLVVKEELSCYEVADISFIENIMIGELKERNHRHLLRTEEFSETESIRSRTEEKDYQVTERFGLQIESASTIKQEVSGDAGVTINTWGPNYNATATGNVAGSFSKSTSQRLARTYAKEIVDRSVLKIQESVRELRSKTRIEEIEEINTHKFEGVDPNSHRAGIYHWVNKKTKAQVMSYGKRMMFDLIIPEPSALYKHLMELQFKDQTTLEEPEKPTIIVSGSEVTLHPDLITDNNYLDLVQEHDISGVVPPIPKEVIIPFALSATPGAIPNYVEEKSITIPPEYKIKDLKWDPSGGWYIFTGSGDIKIFIGDLQYKNGAPVNLSTGNIKGLTGTIPLVVMANNLNAYGFSMEIECERLEEVYIMWQLEVYEKIMASYYEKKAAYDSELERIKNQKLKYGRNPFLNREIERTELKRSAISILMCKHFTNFNAMKEKVEPCGFPHFDFKQSEEEGKIIQFFEQAFDWHLMTYLFYTDQWARLCKWPEMIDINSGDPLFDKFLKSGAAKIQIPVRPELEDYVNWFLTTGEIWGLDGDPPIPGDPHYISIIQEIKEQKQCHYTDRDGYLSVVNGSDIVALHDSGYHWDYINGQVDQLLIDNDIDREIVIDCVVYRIIKIVQVGTNPEKWKIQLDRNYEGDTTGNIKFQVGALFVGAPWEVNTPTQLIYLRNDKDCLPCYPLPPCPVEDSASGIGANTPQLGTIGKKNN